MNKERKMLFTLALLQFTNVLDFMIMAPLAPQLMRTFDIGTAEFGYILSSYTISAGLSGFASAFIADRLDRKTLLWYAYIGFLIGTALCAFAPTYYFLLFARLFTGAFGGVLGATGLSIISDTIPQESRGQAMGIVMGSFSLASVLGIPLGLFLANSLPSLSWHAPFAFLAILGVPIVFAVNAFIPNVNGHLKKAGERESPLTILNNVISDNNQLRALMLMSAMMFAQFIIVPFISPSMVFNVGLSEADLPQIYFFGGLFTIFTGPLIGKLADKYGKKQVLRIVAFLSVFPVLAIANLGHVAIWMALAATTGFFIFSSGRGIVASALVSNAVAPIHRGSFMAINSSIQQLAAGLATLVGGQIVTKTSAGYLMNLPTVGYISVGVALAALFMVAGVKGYEEIATPTKQLDEIAAEPEPVPVAKKV